MPTYNYRCDPCEFVAEATHSIHYEGAYKCNQCGEPMRKLFTPVATHFKGGGWGGSYPKRTYKASVEKDLSTGEVGKTTVEDIGPATPKGTKDSSLFDK